MVRQIWLGLGVLLFLGCNNDEISGKKEIVENEKSKQVEWMPPPPDSVVDQIEQKIDEDQLNKKYFRITLVSTAESKSGSYLLKLEYGFNKNERLIQLPQWTNNMVLRPSIKKGTDKYHCFIGFDAQDNQFHELYEIKVTNGDVSLKQTRGYYPVK